MSNLVFAVLYFGYGLLKLAFYLAVIGIAAHMVGLL